LPAVDPASNAVAGLQLFRWQSNLLTVSRSKYRLKPLPPPLRWVLALLLILNGTAATPVIGHAAMVSGHDGTVHSTSTHCHVADAAAAQGSEKNRKGDCSCCFHGDACQCARVVASVLPPAFSDLRPLAPHTLTDRFRVPAPAAVPLHRLLRPPISLSPFAAQAA